MAVELHDHARQQASVLGAISAEEFLSQKSRIAFGKRWKGRPRLPKGKATPPKGFSHLCSVGVSVPFQQAGHLVEQAKQQRRRLAHGQEKWKISQMALDFGLPFFWRKSKPASPSLQKILVHNIELRR
jgi:hypothetical protein